MSNYTKATNFANKDILPPGDPGKIVKGTEIDAEFVAIANAIASKPDANSPTLTGTPLAPTAPSGTNDTQIATTAFVQNAFGGLGTLASQSASSVAITGGSITGITPIAIADGGTGSSTKAAGFNALAPTTSAGDLIVHNGSNNVRLAAGTNGYVLASNSALPNGIEWVPSVFTMAYTSGGLAPTNAGSYSLSHGFGTVPTLIKLYAVCQSAFYGYAVGDWVDISYVQSTWTTGTVYSVGPSVSMTSSNIYIKFGSTVAFGMVRKDTGGVYLVSNATEQAKWTVVVRAWA